MKIEWNNCFLCLNDLTGQQVSEKDGGRQGKGKRRRKNADISVLETFSRQTVLLLNYLLTNQSGKYSGVISDIKQLVERKGDEGSGVKFCEKCECQMRRVSELHRELEVVQMKLVSVLKGVKETVLQNSKKGEGSGNVGLEIFEQWLREQESNYAAEEENEKEKRRLKEQRRFLEILEAFQSAVMENDKESIDIPKVFLDKYTHFRPKPPQRPPEVIVKTEYGDLDDFLNSPISPDHEDFDFDPFQPPPKKRGSKPKRQKRTPSDIEIKKEILRPPRTSTSTARLKMIEINNSYKQTKKQVTAESLTQPPPRKRYKVPPIFQKKPHSKLKQHFKRHLHTLYCCDLCRFTVRSLYSLEEHLQNHENEVASQDNPPPPKFQCDLCPTLKFHLEQSSELHKLEHSDHYAILCELCNVWRPPMTFKDHMKTHFEKTFPCPNCSYCATNRDKYIAHLFDHHQSSSILECDICGMRSSTRVHFLDHYFQVHQAIKKLPCGMDGCTKEFLDAAKLAKHKNVHTDRFKCDHCGRTLSSSISLETHKLQHDGIKPWKCDLCSDAYSTKISLQRHKIRCHGAPKLQCDFCEKGFSDVTQLNLHKTVVHTKDGVRCEVPGCGKMFGNKTKLKIHMAGHSEERRFVCDECGSAHKSAQQYKKHKLIHAGEAAKRWKCQYCGKAFLFEKYLVQHVRIHTGEKPFVCDHCGHAFNQYAALYMHKRKCHLGTSSAPPPGQNREERRTEMKPSTESSINNAVSIYSNFALLNAISRPNNNS